MLTVKGIDNMHHTTVAKIEAGDREIKLDEALAIADLYEVPLEVLLGRRPGTQRTSELVYRLGVLTENASQSARDVAVITMKMERELDELPGEFDGADKLKEKAYNTAKNYLFPASKALAELSFAFGTCFQREQERLEASKRR
jgi:hypothetical protein